MSVTPCGGPSRASPYHCVYPSASLPSGPCTRMGRSSRSAIFAHGSRLVDSVTDSAGGVFALVLFESLPVHGRFDASGPGLNPPPPPFVGASSLPNAGTATASVCLALEAWQRHHESSGMRRACILKNAEHHGILPHVPCHSTLSHPECQVYASRANFPLLVTSLSTQGV